MPSLIDISNLSYTYPDGKTALNSVNLRIESGEKVALIGTNGAGKSTLLQHFNGILKPSAGEIRVGGMALNKRNIRKVRALVGLVFQNPDDQLFSQTVYEDVAFGPKYAGLSQKDIDARVDRALAAVGITEYRARNSFHLSGGEKKRVAIATVLAMDPEILIFDEPTAGLDPRGRRELMDWLAAQPQTFLVASHDMEMVRHLTTRTVILYQGTVVIDGPTCDVLADEAMLLANGLL